MKHYFLTFRAFASTLVFATVLFSCSTESVEEPQSGEVLPIQSDSILTVRTAEHFERIVEEISKEENALYVFDIDNTLLITNDNRFGSDWWFSQTGKDPALKLGVPDSCLYNVLTPLFYSAFDTRPVFDGQPKSLGLLAGDARKTIALTSRAYSPVISSSTELELRKNKFNFMSKDSAAMENGFILLNDIIYTKGGNKGTALVEYITEHPYDKVYYFDDSENKVVDVQRAFENIGKDISLYHLTIAPKIPYTPQEKQYMEDKLRILIQSLNAVGPTGCTCANP